VSIVGRRDDDGSLVALEMRRCWLASESDVLSSTCLLETSLTGCDECQLGTTSSIGGL